MYFSHKSKTWLPFPRHASTRHQLYRKDSLGLSHAAYTITSIIIWFIYMKNWKKFIWMYSQRSCIRICHPILTEPWLVCQYLNIFTKIARSYSQILYSASNIYVPWIICQDPMQIFFKSYHETSIRIQLWYCLAYFLILYLNTPLLPRTHVFFVCRSLKLGCMPPCTSPSTPCSVEYYGDCACFCVCVHAANRYR